MAPKTRKKKLVGEEGAKPPRAEAYAPTTKPTARQPTHSRATRTTAAHKSDSSKDGSTAAPVVELDDTASTSSSRKRARDAEDKDETGEPGDPKRARKDRERLEEKSEAAEVPFDIQACVAKRTTEIRAKVSRLGEPILSRRPAPHPKHIWKPNSIEHSQEIANLVYEHRFWDRVNEELKGPYTQSQIDVARECIDEESPELKQVHIDFPLEPCEVPEGEYLHTALPSGPEKEWVDPVQEYAYTAWIQRIDFKTDGISYWFSTPDFVDQPYNRRLIAKKKEEDIVKWMDFNEQPFSQGRALGEGRPRGAGKQPNELNTWKDFSDWRLRRTSSPREKISFEAWKRRRAVDQFLTIRANVKSDNENGDLSAGAREEAEAILQSMPILVGPEPTSKAAPTQRLRRKTNNGGNDLWTWPAGTGQGNAPKNEKKCRVY